MIEFKYQSWDKPTPWQWQASASLDPKEAKRLAEEAEVIKKAEMEAKHFRRVAQLVVALFPKAAELVKSKGGQELVLNVQKMFNVDYKTRIVLRSTKEILAAMSSFSFLATQVLGVLSGIAASAHKIPGLDPIDIASVPRGWRLVMTPTFEYSTAQGTSTVVRFSNGQWVMCYESKDHHHGVSATVFKDTQDILSAFKTRLDNDGKKTSGQRHIDHLISWAKNRGL